MNHLIPDPNASPLITKDPFKGLSVSFIVPIEGRVRVGSDEISRGDAAQSALSWDRYSGAWFSIERLVNLCILYCTGTRPLQIPFRVF